MRAHSLFRRCVVLSFLMVVVGLLGVSVAPVLADAPQTVGDCANPVTFNANRLACTIMCTADMSSDNPLILLNACNACSLGATLGTEGVNSLELLPVFAAKCSAEALATAKRLANSVGTALCSKGRLGCCLEEMSPGIGGEKRGRLTKETCEGTPPVYYGDCICLVKDILTPPVGNQSYAECAARCKDQSGTVDASQGVGRFPPPEGSASIGGQNVNALCWVPENCAEAGGTFIGVDIVCPSGQGKCRAPEPVLTMSNPILGKSTVTGLRSYVDLLFRYAISISVIAAAVMFVWGGLQYIFGASFGSISAAKETMVNAAVGLILMFSSIAILRSLNPATISYSQLDIFMINKTAFNLQTFCRDFKPLHTSTPLKFADSGDPPGSTTYDKAVTNNTFTLAKEDTACGKEYYAQNFTGQRCVGSKCPDKAQVCLSCESGAKECNGSKGGFACVKAVMAGTISWTDGIAPKTVYLLGVCNNIQPNNGQHFNSAKVVTNVPINLNTKLNSASGDAGTTGFTYAGGADDLTQLTSACSSLGGLRGVVLGVIYVDKERGGGGIISSDYSVNDVAIITKKDCGNTGSGYLSGYADGTATSFDSTDMKTAIYCGARARPGEAAGSFNSTFSVNNLWTQMELQKAINGEQAIQCDFGLTTSNAPPDPGTKLMSGCQASWCPASEQDCNS